MSTQIDNLAKVIWEYHHINHTLEKADCIIVLGSHDIRVAERGAELYLSGYAPIIVYSGGLGKLTRGKWTETEADKFSKIALKMGVPERDILVENKSTNTGENIIFTRKLLQEQNFHPKKVIAVQKPYMERRMYATFKKLWPEVGLIVTSPQISFEKYPNEEISKDEVINIMIGNLQRIKLYSKKGFQIPQEIPDKVWSAYEQLLKFGYTKHLITA